MLFSVPPMDAEPYPSLGGQVCDWIEDNLVFGPGDLRGEPAHLDAEKRALIWRMYEVFPVGHPQAGRRRFRRVAISVRKGWSKTELAAWLTAAELHPDAPVRFDYWDEDGNPVGKGVTDPFIPMVAVTEEQSEELAYGALRVILERSRVADDFDIGIERIMRIGGDGKALPLASSPDARDGARTTFQVFDEPLALTTTVPTPTGWTTMGDIQPGDRVFGRDGTVCNVVGLSPVHEGRDCYRVVFGDGTAIVADAGHKWLVRDHSPSYRCERVVTTEFMAQHRWGHSRRFVMVDSAPLDLPDADLPVEPYVFGLWLGDGDARNATITAGETDVDETEASIRAVGYAVTRCAARSRAPLMYVTFADSRPSGWGATNGVPANRSMVGALRSMDVLTNKHIPPIYLRASVPQRLALLQGLMDADGHTDKQGHCTFSNNNLRLVRDVRELLYSLKYQANQAQQIDNRWSEPKTQYKLHFTPRPELPPFRLQRKRARLATTLSKQQKVRSIVSVEPVASVPVRCIEVDSSDHLFLAGEAMLPTHNTHRHTLPRLKAAHRTMLANLPKRKLSDAWALEITTAPAPGEGSVAEDTMEYARQVGDGRIADSRLFFFHRQASDGHDLSTPAGIRAAVLEASGPVAEWSDIDGIVEQWADPTADRAYLERVWLNRLVRSGDRAFDGEKWRKLARADYWPEEGAQVTIGFDGSRYHDATALIGCEIESGHLFTLGIWERPLKAETWEVPEDEVTAALAAAMERYSVWRLYADPPYWETAVANWAGTYGDDKVMYWRTNRTRPMAGAVAAFNSALLAGEISHDGNRQLAAHVGNACRRIVPVKDEKGEKLWTIYKERPDSPHKIDGAMASILAWEARRDAIAAGVLATTADPTVMVLSW